MKLFNIFQIAVPVVILMLASGCLDSSSSDDSSSGGSSCNFDELITDRDREYATDVQCSSHLAAAQAHYAAAE